MAEYKDGRGNTSRGRSGMSFCSHSLSTRRRVFNRDQDNSRKCTHCNQTNHTIDRCWELYGKPFRPPRAAYLSNPAGSSTAYDSNILGTFTDEFVTLSKSEYNSLIQKMHSVSASNITILTHPNIFV